MTLIWCLWGQFSETPITLSACDLQKPMGFLNFQNHFFECLIDLAHFFCPKSQIFECMRDLAYFFTKLMNVLCILLTFGFRWLLHDSGLAWKWRMYAAVCLLLVSTSFNASWKYRMYAAVRLLFVLVAFDASCFSYMFNFCITIVKGQSLSCFLMFLNFAASQ